MTRNDVVRLQTRLAELGFEPGPIDGEMGPRTRSAIIAFKRSRGLLPRDYVGPITWAALFEERPAPKVKRDDLPWMAEARAVLGRHEVTDNGWLRRWLGSDGHALGDPATLPWCGDFVETSIRLALPEEPIPANPYWALNWRKFGKPTKPTYGAVASVSRDGGGHVAFLVGQDRTRFYCLGGNQSNRVSIVPMDKARFPADAFRWPATYPVQKINLPWMNSGAAANTAES